MRATHYAAALLAGLFSQGALASCYVVYAADQQIIYRSQRPPVDLSRNLHETLPRVAPGGTMVFSLDDYGCELEIHRLPTATPAGTNTNGSATPVRFTPRPARANRG